MSDRKSPLADLCGGRFAFMPAAACEASDLSNGAFRLYAILCARANLTGTCEVSLKSIAAKAGVCPRTVQNWKRRLELEGWVEELHEGDKAIGMFRVIRNPAERKAVRLRNAIKVGIRSATKTPHAKKSSHPRCEGNFTHYKKEDRTPLDLPAELAAEGTSPTLDSKQARQGDTAATGSGSIPPAPRQLKQKTPARQPNWQVWARWLAATRPMNEKEAWLWLMDEIGRLAEEHGISSEDAGWMLHRRLKREKELGE